MSELTLIRASAGSGKTYTLTLKYLELLFEYENNYKRILAVTFTNKATEEMKSRIISQLNSLANDNNSGYKDYLIKKFGFTETQLRKKSKNILSKILHDYSKFSVSTIDSFFQKILKSFAKEINLQFDFTIELDSYSVLDDVIELILNEISENNELKNWITKFIKEKVNSDGNVNVKKEIYTLGKEIFKEVFINFNQNKIDKTKLDEFVNELRKVKNNFETEISKKAQKTIDYAASQNLFYDDFSYKKTSFFAYFKKIIDKKEYDYGVRVLNSIDNLEKWYNKNSDKKDIIIDNYPVINKSLKDVVEFYDKNSEIYYSANVSLSYFFTLGIVSDILKKLTEYTKENNLFLLSDTAKFINLIIDNNDVPFIYEKIGSIFKFYMIDEFQDTSELQWNNFKPLIDNSLAEGNRDLIVGDIKQSIYRWRNGNWELLANKVSNDLFNYKINSYSLDTNWRSEKNIIDFNNSIFKNYSALLQQEFNTLSSINDNTIINAYADVEQKIPVHTENSKTKGYVKIEFIEQAKKDDCFNEAIQKVIEIIENLQDNNYQPRDIAILVRTKSDGEKIANYLLDYKNSDKANKKYKYDVVSNEALLIKNSSAVKLIISVLKYFINPGDLINRAETVYFYNNFFSNETNINLNNLFIKLTDINEFYKLLPSEFKANESKIKSLPLYEMINNVINIFQINKNKNSLPFLISFNDFVADFQSNTSSDLFSFVEHWNEKGETISISVSDSQNAIKILTIHKSKGLQFPAVIMPSVNWKIEPGSDKQPILWCKSNQYPFSILEFIPVKYTSELSNTLFKDYYFAEKLRLFIDNINLLYVGFTRAEKALFIMSQKTNSNKISRVGEALALVMENNFNNFKLKNNNNIYKIGELSLLDKKHQVLQAEPIVIDNFATNYDNNKLALKYSHVDSTSSGKSGILYHKIFENIILENDIDKAVNKLLVSGEIKLSESKKIKTEIKNFINSSNQVKQWFNNFVKVIVEQDIITENKMQKRPDRIVFYKDKIIVIDYKFGNIEKTEYISQVKEYINLLTRMGYNNVKGAIWYVSKNKVVNV